MSAVAAFVRTWRIGAYSATLSIPRTPAGFGAAVIEWAPSMPRRLGPAELRTYRAGRARAFAEFTAETGMQVAVIEV